MRQPPICCREIKPKKPGGSKRWVIYYAKHDYERYRITVDRCDRKWFEEKLMTEKPWSSVEKGMRLERKLNNDKIGESTVFAEVLAPVKEHMDAHKWSIISSAAVAACSMFLAAGIGWFTFIHAVNADQAPPQASVIKRSVK